MEIVNEIESYYGETDNCNNSNVNTNLNHNSTEFNELNLNTQTRNNEKINILLKKILKHLWSFHINFFKEF